MNSKISKEYVINYIFKNVNISNYRYRLVEFENDLSLLKDMSYMSPNYSGVPALLLFFKIKNEYFALAVDRKTLNYDINKINPDEVKMMKMNIQVDESIYNGTIFDGILLNGTIERMRHYIITDVYMFKGEDLSKEDISDKLLRISTFLGNTVYDKNLNCNVVLVVNKLYDLSQANMLFNVYIPKSIYSGSIKGLAFYPKISSIKLIFLYNNSDEEKKTKIIDDKNIRKPEIEIGGEEVICPFRMKKGDIVDIYWLYIAVKEISDGKQCLRYKKFVKAYLPTKEVSHFCNDVFSNVDCVIVDCKYDSQKDKWIPINISEKKRPAYKEEIENMLK